MSETKDFRKGNGERPENGNNGDEPVAYTEVTGPTQLEV